MSKGAQTGCNGTAFVTGKTVYGTPVFVEFKPLIAYAVGEVTGYFSIEILRKSF